MAEEQDTPMVEWDIANVTPQAGEVVQNTAGTLYYLPEPYPTKVVQFPETESIENQKYGGDSPEMQGWVYIDEPIQVDLRIGDRLKPVLYLHARITADGKLQFGVFAEKNDEETMMLQWDSADVKLKGEEAGCPEDIGWGTFRRGLIIADSGAVEGVLVKDGKLNLACDPKLIGPLAPCNRRNVWDTCGGGGPMVLYGYMHSLWGCIVNDVLYMHVFCHEDFSGEDNYTGDYLALNAPVYDEHGERSDCGCRLIKTDLIPPNCFSVCNIDSAFDDCLPDPDAHSLYKILGFKFSLCCGAQVVADAEKLANEVIGTAEAEDDYVLQEDIATVDDASHSGPCFTTQDRKGDIGNTYVLLTKNGGMYDGEWTVTQREHVCDSPDENIYKGWERGGHAPGFPYESEKDVGDWAESGKQSFGEAEWPSQHTRENNGDAAQGAFMYTENGKVHIDMLRCANIYEFNTAYEVKKHTVEDEDLFIDVGTCCMTCGGVVRHCFDGTAKANKEMAGGPVRYIKIDAAIEFAADYPYRPSEHGRPVHHIVVENTYYDSDPDLTVAEAIEDTLKYSPLCRLFLFDVNGTTFTAYLNREFYTTEEIVIDTCLLTVSYKVGSNTTMMDEVAFDECVYGAPDISNSVKASSVYAKRAVAAGTPCSGQAPFVPMENFYYKVSLYGDGFSTNEVGGFAENMGDMASGATLPLGSGIRMSADGGLLTVNSTEGEGTVTVNLYGNETDDTPIQSILVMVEKDD